MGCGFCEALGFPERSQYRNTKEAGQPLLGKTEASLGEIPKNRAISYGQAFPMDHWPTVANRGLVFVVGGGEAEAVVCS